MDPNILEEIHSPEDLRKLSAERLQEVSTALRKFIIDIVATKEGHLGASLGVVELTIALHYAFNTPKDLLVWDVGHQAYGHKILTGRRENFHTNRRLNGISGFPKREESEYDIFGVGHSSTAISAALGMAIASNLKGEFSKHHIAVVGDASIASGMAFEGLNHAGVTKANLLVVLNDNAIGIDPSVGALKQYLTKARVGYKPKQSNIIEALNFKYFGPVDGHDIAGLLEVFEQMKQIEGPKFLHVITTKGKGLKKAEEDQVKYHAPGKFKPDTGELLTYDTAGLPLKYQDVFGLTLVELAKKNEKIIGITPAMPTGSSLKFMMQAFPERAFDVGIAEQHAVTLSAGMATQGFVVFCAIYSTFLQRAYDQVIHDVALQKLPVVFCLDRAGLVGEDGATHHGVFDIAYLRCIPNIIIAAPSNETELRNLLYTAQLDLRLPMAIRYPRGRGVQKQWETPFEEVEIGKASCLQQGDRIAVLSIGNMVQNATKAIKKVKNETVGHYDMRFVKPLDEEVLHFVFKKYKVVITIEDGVVTGGFGSVVLEFAAKHDYKAKIRNLGLPDEFIEQGNIDELQEIAKINVQYIEEEIVSLIQNL
ncbi:1-deoxy-D-xylulose-5-phosphate synthase [Salegentibacter salarius]|uniref:1-deoxy-D-xylulose-5-phosphate synthase n=1 Tax=Salegentibacter salarius TaxID=435906 RepID=A0A2N0TUW9_9FLAO|nr:1-deoxy-D-xylulose-5-phosphate synthase [Salegentibacter salarius]OEY72203.1 1-deoxy-D-xylulose-5-phosphate synthase [Salegentibacter salarius]PKD18524.1 1-deoxy-D-xylulose-5-phosphate synthase [Salegentibacter salarius]SLJ88104.1 1-deoxy-D-xylulose-5-phosphate synthase [Salegentibacter salarius]